jgi:hypothetical protein
MKKVFYLFAAFFTAAALYHFAGLFYPGNEAPVWRHALFVCINLFMASCMLQRPKWFVFVFFILLVQQLYSHGSSLLQVYNQTNQISGIDLAVVIATPVMFAVLVADALHTKQPQAIS